MKNGTQETEPGGPSREVGAVGGSGGAADGNSPDRLVRLAVNLGPETAEVLKEYASRKGISVTEAVRRAIGLLAFVDEAQRRGASLNIDEGGVLKEIVFLA